MSTNTAARSDIRQDIKLEEIRVERVVAGHYRAYDRVTGEYIATAINCARGSHKADWNAWGGADVPDTTSLAQGATRSRHRTYNLGTIARLGKVIIGWSRGTY
jgi:hypothetical protein